MRIFTLSLVLLSLVLFPGSVQARSSFTFSISIGSGVVVGAGFIYWGIHLSTTHYSHNNSIPEPGLTTDVALGGTRPFKIKTQTPKPGLPLQITSSGNSPIIAIPFFRW